jgi:hypothetical protein
VLSAGGDSDFAAGDGFEAAFVGSLGKFHGAVEVVVVGEGEGGVAEAKGALDELVGGGSPSRRTSRRGVKLRVRVLRTED